MPDPTTTEPEPVAATPAAPTPFVDPDTGLTGTMQDGRVWFKSGGKFFSAGSVAEGLQHDGSAQLASPAEVSGRLAVREQDNLAGQAKIAAKQVGTHAFDVATGIIRYPLMAGAALLNDKEALSELQSIGGEQVFQNAYGLYRELRGQNQEAAGREYKEATKNQLEANPLTGEVAGIAGDIVPTLATGGLSATGKLTGGLLSEQLAAGTVGKIGTGALAKAGEHAFAAAIQGAGFGMQAASENTYLTDDPLTRQKVWASGAMGGLLGGVIGGGVSLLGSGARAVLKPRLGTIVGPVEVAPKSSIAEAIGDSGVSKEAAQNVAERAMAAEGVPAAPGLGEKLHSLLTDIQSSATGAEKEAVGKYGLGAILDPKTRVAALDGIRIFRERPQIIEGASAEISDSMKALQAHADNGVFQEVRDLGMKRNAWEKLVDPAKRGEQVDAARSFLAETRGKLEGMLKEAPEGDLSQPAMAEPGANPADILNSGVGGFRYLRSGMRDLEQHRGAYDGASADEATEIAMGEAPAKNTGEYFAPVEVHVQPGEPPILADGRHRVTAAKEAGATDVIAKVRYYDVEGNLLREEKATLPIGELTPSESAGRMPSAPRYAELEGKVKGSLSPEEQKEIKEYTTTSYTGINDAARDANAYAKKFGYGAAAENQAKNRRLNKILEQQVESGNVYRGEVQRVMTVPDELADEWANSGSISNESVWSTTADANSLATTTEGKLRGNVRLHIADSDAVPVSSMSKVPAEKEAIIPQGRTFYVNKSEEIDGVRHIWLEQARTGEERAVPKGNGPGIGVEPATFGDLKRVKSLLGHAKKAEKLLAGDVSGADAAIELDAFKRNLGKLTKGSVKKLQSLEQAGDFEADLVRNTARTLSDTYESLRQHLTNEEIWGKAATAQKEINQGWQDWIDSRSMYSGSLMRRTGSEGSGEFGMWDTRARFEIDPNKVGSWIDQFGTGRGKLNDHYVQAHIDATDKLTSAIGKYVDTGSAADSVGKVREAVKKIQTQLGVARETVAVANQVQLVGGAQMSGAAKMAMAAGGAMAGGPIGGAAGAALGFIMSPGKVMQAAMAIQGLLEKVNTEKAGHLDSFFSKAGRKAAKVGKAAEAGAEDYVYTEGLNTSRAADTAAKAGKRAVTDAAMRLFGNGSAEAQAENYGKRREQLALLTSSPELMAHQTARALGPLPTIAPQFASAVSMDASRNLALLQRMAPVAAPIGGMFGGKRQTFTPQAEIAKFAQQWDGVMNPLSVLKDLNKGALNMDKVAAAKAAHPELFAEIAGDFLDRMASMEGPMNPQAALQADILLGLNGAGEPSVAPAFLARIASLQQAQAAQGPQPSPRPPVNLAKGTATLSQTLEGA
jgi:hypothetical protein